jgi:ornithine--oxo-acid transaminase
VTILDARISAQANGTDTAITLVERYAAHNYSPLPVVAASAEGAWITDVDGRR